MKLGRKFIVSYLFTFCNYFYEIFCPKFFGTYQVPKQKTNPERSVFGAGNEI